MHVRAREFVWGVLFVYELGWVGYYLCVCVWMRVLACLHVVYIGGSLSCLVSCLTVCVYPICGYVLVAWCVCVSVWLSVCVSVTVTVCVSLSLSVCVCVCQLDNDQQTVHDIEGAMFLLMMFCGMRACVSMCVCVYICVCVYVNCPP